MASGYSTPGQFRHYTPVDPFNEELTAMVLGAKQTRYDSNLAQLDQTLQEYGNIDLAREQDKVYLQERLNKLTGEINNAGMQDLSSSAVTRNITNHIDQALDDNILNQVANTQKFRRFQAEVQKTREDSPELYSDANMQYALQESGFNQWYNGDSDKLGQLNYTPYVDVAQQYQEIFDEAVSVKDGITTTLPDNQGYLVTESYKGMKPSEVRARVISSLNPQQRKQLEINAWSKYGQNSEAIFQQYMQPKLAEYDKKVEALRANYDGKTAAQKAAIDQEVKILNAEKKELSSRKGSASALYQTLGQEELIQSLSQTYKPVRTKYEFEKDQTYYERLKNSTKTITDTLGDSSFVLDGNKNTRPDVIATPGVTETPEQEILMEQKYNESIQQDTESLNQLYNSLSPEAQSQFNSAYEVYKQDNPDAGDDIISKMSVLIDESNGGKGSLLKPSQISQAKATLRQLSSKLEGKKQAFNEATKGRQDKYFQTIFTGLKENPNIKITDPNGNVVSGAKYLEGIDSVDQLSENAKRSIMRSTFADLTLSQTKDFERDTTTGEIEVNKKNAYNISRLASINNEIDKELPILLNPSDIIVSTYSKEKFDNDFESLKQDMQLPVSLTKSQFNEYIKPLLGGAAGEDYLPDWLRKGVRTISDFTGVTDATNILEKTSTNITRSLGWRDVADNIIIGGEGTKTRADLERALENKTYDRFSLTDDSVEDDSNIRTALNDKEEVRQKYLQNLKPLGGLVMSNNVITIESSGTREGEIVGAWEDIKTLAAKENVTFDKGEYINLVDKGDYYMAYTGDTQNQITTGSDDKTIQRLSSKSARIEKSNVNPRNAPNFVQWIQGNQTNSIDVSNTKEIQSDKITFADEGKHREYIVDIAKNVLGGGATKQQLDVLTSQGAKRMLVENHKDIFNDPTTSQTYKQLINRMIDNSHLVDMRVKANDMDTYDLILEHKAGDNREVLNVQNLGIGDITNSVKMFDTMPQYFYFDYINRLLTNIERNGAESEAERLNTLFKIFLPDAR